MLGLLLIFGAIQLALACGLFVFSRRRGTAALLLGGLIFLLVMPVLGSKTLVIQCLLLLALGLALRMAKARAKTFAVTATAASLALVVIIGLAEHNRWSRLQTRYPVESLASRLSYEIPRGAQNDSAVEGEKIAPASAQSLATLDELYDQHSSDYLARRRTQALRLVHASQVEQFVASEGFGVGRGMSPAIWTIELPSDRGPIDLSEPASPCCCEDSNSAEEYVPQSEDYQPLREVAQKPAASEFDLLHTRALIDFANPGTFGYMTDHDHVIGFEKHRFREVPRTATRGWRTERVELVSLLKHERPMVYVSEHLPAMDELAAVPVRPLSEFEEQSLASLRRGGDVETSIADDEIHMLGAIRAARQCLACHNVRHGALLGAFSYEFLPKHVQRPKPDPLSDEPEKPTAARSAPLIR